MWPIALLKQYNTPAVQATFISAEGKLSPSILCCWGLPQQEVLATGMEFSERVLSDPLYNVLLEGPRVLGIGQVFVARNPHFPWADMPWFGAWEPDFFLPSSKFSFKAFMGLVLIRAWVQGPLAH